MMVTGLSLPLLEAMVTPTPSDAIPRPALPECQVDASACAKCAGDGRAVIGGIDRHCSCPVGRRMAGAHWSEKAAEEVAA
jgi:hypothetical protein